MPLIIAGGPAKVGVECDTPVSLVNLYPTLLSLCGLPANDHSLRTKRWRYTRWRTGEEELYDHDNDSMEWENLAKNPEFSVLKRELSQWFPEPVKLQEPKKRKK